MEVIKTLIDGVVIIEPLECLNKERLYCKDMNVIKTNIEGALLIEPKVFNNSRGYFFESFSQREFDENYFL